MTGGFCIETDTESRRKRIRRWVQLNGCAVEKIFNKEQNHRGKMVLFMAWQIYWKYCSKNTRELLKSIWSLM